jgi:hypothetical protein
MADGKSVSDAKKEEFTAELVAEVEVSNAFQQFVMEDFLSLLLFPLRKQALQKTVKPSQTVRRQAAQARLFKKSSMLYWTMQFRNFGTSVQEISRKEREKDCQRMRRKH